MTAIYLLVYYVVYSRYLWKLNHDNMHYAYAVFSFFSPKDMIILLVIRCQFNVIIPSDILPSTSIERQPITVYNDYLAFQNS